MDTLTTRQKLYDYIKFADDEKVEAIYTLVKDEANERYEWWNDEELMAELEQISADMESGKDKGVPWNEVKASLLNRRKKE